MRPAALLIPALAAALAAPAAGFAEDKDAPVVRARAFLATDKLPAGGETKVAVVLDIKEGWHITGNPAPTEFAVPTTVKITTAAGTKIGEFAFPKEPLPKNAPAGTEAEPVAELHGRVVLIAPVTVPAGLSGSEEVTVAVRYQPCNDSACLRPKTVSFSGTLPVAPAGTAVRPANRRWFAPATESGTDPTRTAKR